ncbi:hypothetical protein AND_004569 [Anopheles darlingi]|uniref:Uncharacterized protein n=1 Tax=Anopheles darlingi TaxID=43151 RepID=W5JLS6_ANODA|nr:hypothetical protein AND_004569 [Anopheles darlingi]
MQYYGFMNTTNHSKSCTFHPTQLFAAASSADVIKSYQLDSTTAPQSARNYWVRLNSTNASPQSCVTIGDGWCCKETVNGSTVICE